MLSCLWLHYYVYWSVIQQLLAVLEISILCEVQHCIKLPASGLSVCVCRTAHLGTAAAELLFCCLLQDWDKSTIEWFTNKKIDEVPLPEFKLNFLWVGLNIAVAVDQVYARGQISPLTEYFFWPRDDAWDQLRVALEARPWISET